MKKLLLLIALVISANVYSQTYPMSCVRQDTTVRFRSSLEPIKATFSQVIVPVNYFKIQKDSLGHYNLGIPLSVGVAWVLGQADVVINTNSVTLSETFYYGICTFYSNTLGQTATSGLTGAIIGGFNQFSVLAGRDFIANEWDFGVAFSLAGLPFLHSTTKINIK